MKQLVCIVCPRGCHLAVDDENGYVVTGHACSRGAEYGRKELQSPTRMVTSTVRISGAEICRLPVKTDREIPKAIVLQAVRLLNDVDMEAPVSLGDVVTEIPIPESGGARFVATRSLPHTDNAGKSVL